MNRVHSLVIASVTAAALLLVGCTAPTTPEPPRAVATAGAVAEKVAASALANTEWQLESLWPPEIATPVVPGTDVTLGFGIDRYTGFGGCDWFMGMYSITNGELWMQQPAKTLAGCVNKPQATDQQATFLSMLQSVVTYEVKDNKLVFYNTDKQQMLTMVPLQAVPFEGTTWDALFAFTTEGGVWNPILPGANITAIFDGQTLSGSAGCNDYSATYQRQGDRLTLGPVTATKRSCATPEGVMDQEQAYLELLGKAQAIQQFPRSIELLTSDATPLLAFHAQ